MEFTKSDEFILEITKVIFNNIKEQKNKNSTIKDLMENFYFSSIFIFYGNLFYFLIQNNKILTYIDFFDFDFFVFDRDKTIFYNIIKNLDNKLDIIQRLIKQENLSSENKTYLEKIYTEFNLSDF